MLHMALYMHVASICHWTRYAWRNLEFFFYQINIWIFFYIFYCVAFYSFVIVFYIASEIIGFIHVSWAVNVFLMRINCCDSWWLSIKILIRSHLNGLGFILRTFASKSWKSHVLKIIWIVLYFLHIHNFIGLSTPNSNKLFALHMCTTIFLLVPFPCTTDIICIYVLL